MKKVMFAMLVLMMSTAPAWSEVLDIYTGTLEIHDGVPMLIRCDFAENTYLLEDENGLSERFLKQFQALGVTPESKYAGSIIGSVRMDGDQAILKVKSIENISAGTCHMRELLGGFRK